MDQSPEHHLGAQIGVGLARFITIETLCGIARCCCEPGLESGSFLGPDAKARIGPAELLPSEHNPATENLLWDESMKAGGLDVFFH